MAVLATCRGGLTVQNVAGALYVSGSLGPTGVLTISQAQNSTSTTPAVINAVQRGGLVQSGTLASTLDFNSEMAGTLLVYEDVPQGARIKLTLDSAGMLLVTAGAMKSATCPPRRFSVVCRAEL